MPHISELRHNDLFTKTQADFFVDMGIMQERPNVLRSDTIREYERQELGLTKGSTLTRSNFDRSKSKFNLNKNEAGIYEIPYRFSKEFPYGDMVKVSH